MSKMSQIHAELMEQASELGFQSIEEAEACGYMVVYSEDKAELLPRDPLEQLNEAHKEWLKEREEVLEELRDLRDAYRGVEHTEDVLSKTINFIEKGEI